MTLPQVATARRLPSHAGCIADGQLGQAIPFPHVASGRLLGRVCKLCSGLYLFWYEQT